MDGSSVGRNRGNWTSFISLVIPCLFIGILLVVTCPTTLAQHPPYCSFPNYALPTEYFGSAYYLHTKIADQLPVKNQSLKLCESINKILVGSEPGIPMTTVNWDVPNNLIFWGNPIFPTFTQAYHTLGIPAVHFWPETVEFHEELRAAEVNIHQMVVARKVLEGIRDDCDASYRKINLLNSTAHNDTIRKLYCQNFTDDFFQKCISKAKDFQHYILNEIEPFYDRYMRACYQSITITMEAFRKGTTRMSYNGKEIKWPNSPNYMMLIDTLEYVYGIKQRVGKGGTFQKYIKSLEADGQLSLAQHLNQTLKEIKARLNNRKLPYFHLYSGGKDSAGNVKAIAFKNFRLEVDGLYTWTNLSLNKKLNFQQHAEGWKKDIENFKKDLADGTARDFTLKLIYLYKKYAQVYLKKQSTENEPPAYSYNGEYENGILVGDGMWEWKYNQIPIPKDPPNITTPNQYYIIHNLRMGWDLLGAMLEELKCYMKETYYFDLRKKAIQDTQLDIKGPGAHLFSEFSTTMLQPCQIRNYNETDLITEYCTAENHEICAPLTPFHPLQRPKSQYHRGLALLKPKWIFRYDSKTKKCVGRKDYVKRLYVCQCGFRLDCGEDLGENITCQLEPNDMIRGQCRGGVGYPCKTLPLAPGKHHQSCASGYCNMRKNSCEDRPFVHRKYSRGTPTWKGQEAKVNYFLVVCCATLVVLRNYGVF